jgi:hypothetical protein
MQRASVQCLTQGALHTQHTQAANSEMPALYTYSLHTQPAPPNMPACATSCLMRSVSHT